jgi:hypothetical protein
MWIYAAQKRGQGQALVKVMKLKVPRRMVISCLSKQLVAF